MNKITKNWSLNYLLSTAYCLLLLLFVLLMMALPAWASTVDLPRTGQTKCYDAAGTEIACAGTGQDGAIQAGVAWPNPRFTDNGGQTITDNLTGLIWTKNANLPGTAKTWQQALDYVAGMNAGTYTNYGYTDWRLPQINELESLVYASKLYPALPEGHPFTNVQFSYWSATTHGSTDNAWQVYMGDGYVYVSYKTYGDYVWPVRGTSSGTAQVWKTGQTTSYATGDDGDLEMGAVWPNPRFTVSGDCVTDNLTGLMWTKNANLPNGTQTWQGALDYANSLSLCGYTDWRLPNRTELMSLIGRSNGSTLPAGHPFTNVHDYYWSATTSAFTAFAWDVGTTGGDVNYYSKTTGDYVWPVRGGTVDTTPPTGAIDLPKTGQTRCYDTAGTEIACAGTGQDGAIQAGVAWPNPRFTDNSDQTITDNLTGLMWTKDAGIPTVGSCTGGTKTWQDALNYVACLNSNNYLSHNDWRLPQINELESLVDASKYNPALPAGHPFTNVQLSGYWSSTTTAGGGGAWGVGFVEGGVVGSSMGDGYYVWCVRGGTIADSTPPTGTISINSGASYTTSTSVTLTLTCSDAGGCSQMQISNDGVFDTEPIESFATSKAWTLSSGDGTKTVYAKFKDNAGNWSSAYSDTVVLDMTSPDTSIGSGPPSITNSTTATFIFSGADANEIIAIKNDTQRTNPGSFENALYDTGSSSLIIAQSFIATAPSISSVVSP